jgi:mannose-6-phosphate isomerase-like protein (cupin superfamily)
MKTLAASVGFVTLIAMLTPDSADAGATPAQVGSKMGSMVFTWDQIQSTMKSTKTGLRRDVFDAPTLTLDKFHCHITTLNAGENTGALHRHPQEEVVIIKEGTLEINIDGRKQVAGAGSMVFFAANENENMTNIGTIPATYYVLQWFTPLTSKG